MIQAGNRYTYEGEPVIAMQSVERGIVRVRRIDLSVPVINMQRAIDVDSDRLIPAPMKYHGGKIHGDCD